MLRKPEKKGNSGFTLVEALLSLVILALMASVMTGLYFTGLQTLEAGGERMMLDSHLRSKMEELVSMKFDQLADGSDTVAVNGRDYARAWTVVNVDLDGDAIPESTAKQFTVTLAGQSLTTLVVDNEGRLGKI